MKLELPTRWTRWAVAFFLESLTNQLESQAYDYFRKVDDIGGVIPALETGYLQREIADAAYTYQIEEDRRERITVGVNDYITGEEQEMPLLRVDREGEHRQVQKLNDLRRRRDNREVAEKLRNLEQAARGSDNLMPPLLEAVKAYATLGEMMDVFRDVFRGVPALLKLLTPQVTQPAPQAPLTVKSNIPAAYVISPFRKRGISTPRPTEFLRGCQLPREY